MTTLHESVPEKLVERKSAGEPAAAAASAGSIDQHHLHHSRFSDAASSSEPSSLVPESLSSASSFQSLASTLSSKSSSGICADSAPGSPDKTHCFDQSYVNVDIPDLDDLISACANINLNSTAVVSVGDAVVAANNEEEERSNTPDSSADCSQDQTFASAADDTIADQTQIIANTFTEESVIQTFQTCPALEAAEISTVSSSIITTEVFKAPLPVADQSSSVIPYLSFEESVLRKHQDDTEDASEFKSALTSFHLPPFASPSRQRQSYSPTPCVEIDVRTHINEVVTVQTEAADSPANEEKEQQNVSELDSTNTTFEEAQALNSTAILNTELQVEQSNAPVAKTPEKTLFIENLSKTEVDNQKDTNTPKPEEIEIPVNNKIGAQEVNDLSTQEEVVKEENILNKTEVVPEINILNVIQDIVQDKNTLDETREIVQEEIPLNTTQNIVQDTYARDETQNIVQKLNDLNITQDIVKEAVAFEKTQEIVKETIALDRTQEIVKETIALDRTQEIVKETIALDRTQEIVKEAVALEKTQEIVKETVALNRTQEIVNKEEISLNTTVDIVHDNKNNLNKTQELTTPNKNEVVIVKENTLNKSEVIDINKLNETEDLVQNKTQPIINVDTLPEKKEENLKYDIEEPNLKLNAQIREEQKNNLVESSFKANVNVKKDHELFASNRCETFITEDSQIPHIVKTEVIASTPIPFRSFNKSDTPKSPKSKSALFTEVKSPKVQSPQVHKQSVNVPIKFEKEAPSNINFDETVPINKTLEKSTLNATEIVIKDAPHEKSINLLTQQEPEYEAFKPQQQSTTLPFPSGCDFRVLQEAALSVAKDIDASLDKIEESEQFVSATAELFGDPLDFDFLNQLGSQNNRRAERYDSLYMKFDPLAQRLSMLPQKNLPNSPPVNEEEDKQTKTDSPLSDLGTPKKNPAIAAIDRLLFYSPCTPSSTESEVAEAKQKKEEPEKQEPQSVPVVDEKMAKELEIVRSTVLQLEGELEKQRKEYKEQLERQKTVFDDKIIHVQTKFSQMQSQLSQEIKCKDQMTVVVEEYEKSISRLIAEREKDRQNFEVEKSKLTEELQIANQHLSNTEAAFTDVHSKYERLKNVVSAYKSNEEVLKESIAQNKEVIETLEKRYETLKSHAMAQLEKANQELSAIRKHNDAETVKLKALLRKAELKSKSLEETVEQKLKENQELTKIIDEMIARVD